MDLVWVVSAAQKESPLVKIARLLPSDNCVDKTVGFVQFQEGIWRQDRYRLGQRPVTCRRLESWLAWVTPMVVVSNSPLALERWLIPLVVWLNVQSGHGKAEARHLRSHAGVIKEG